MTSKYVTESRAGHVTFLRVFPIGLGGVRYSLFIGERDTLRSVQLRIADILYIIYI